MRLEHQAITNQERLPRHPGARAAQVRCQGRGGTCGKWLGVSDGQHLFINDNRRETVATLPATVRCERCGHTTTLRPA